MTKIKKSEIIERLVKLRDEIAGKTGMENYKVLQYKTIENIAVSMPSTLDELKEIKGIGPHNVFGIRLVQEVAREFLKEKILEKHICKSSKEVFDYLYHSMRDLRKEIFKVLFLDGKNHIIDIEDLFEGTLNISSVYPREIIKSAIKHNATALIFAHNHPSGSPEPSLSDKEITKDLIEASNTMQIKVLDHIIIGDNRYFSFADEGLIEEYNLSFLNMKRRQK